MFWLFGVLPLIVTLAFVLFVCLRVMGGWGEALITNRLDQVCDII